MQKTPEIAKKWLFPTFNTPKLVHFEDIYLQFCTRVQVTGLFYPYFVFKFKNVPQFLENMFFCWFFFNLQNFPNFDNTREHFARNVHSQHSAENQSLLSLNPRPHWGGDAPLVSFSRIAAEPLHSVAECLLARIKSERSLSPLKMMPNHLKYDNISLTELFVKDIAGLYVS